MKKLLSLWIAILATVGGMIGVNAYSYTDDYYDTDKITVTLNGSKIYFDQPPIMQNDRTLVPMRKIFEAMGCLVFWDEDKQSVEAWRGGEYVMTLWVDEYNMKLGNGEYISLDVPPIVVNDRTLVPVRAISESLGADVDWDEYRQTVIITYDYQGNFPDSVDMSNNTEQSDECTHKNVTESCSIDERTYENTGSDISHIVIDVMNTYCKDCGEFLSEYTRERETVHVFEGSVCIDCGYEKEDVAPEEEFVELRNANLLNQDSDHPSSACRWFNGNKLKFNIVTVKSTELGAKPGDKTKLSVEYKLDGKYSKLTANIEGSPYPAYMNIYIDGEKQLQTEQMSSGSRKEIELDLAGAQSLRFEAYSTVSKIVMGTYSEIYLQDGKLWY